MLISYAREKCTVANITIDDDIDKVNICILLGIALNEYLIWYNHIDKVLKKTCQWLHFVLKLKRTKFSSDELVQVHFSLIRTILEYGWQIHVCQTRGHCQ